MGTIAIRLLGRLRVTAADGGKIQVSGRKAQALLVCLAANAGRPQPRERLAALLWGDRFDRQARQSLRQGIAQLRKAFGDRDGGLVAADGDAVTLSAAADVDAVRFQRLADEATPKALSDAAALYAGELAEGLEVREKAFEDWIAAERARFRDLAVDVFSNLTRHHAAAGDTDKAIDTAKRVIQLDPLHEDGHRTLMRLYADAGQRAKALKQYQALTESLKRELGAEPDAATSALLAEIRDQTSPSLPTERAATKAGRQPTREKLAIAVLPFDNLSEDPSQEYFVDGITEDIITALSRNRWLTVVARNSSFGFKGKSLDVRDIARELEADYVVEGSVRKAGNRLRINAQLIDAASGSHVWAERYDRELGEMFALQDEITETIAGRIEPEVGAVERRRAERKPARNLDAWDCYHLGLSHMYKFNRDDNAEAQRLFRRVIEIDPDFAPAYARLAYAIVIGMVYFDAEPAEEVLADALRLARRAADLDDQDAVAHFAVGRVHQAKREYDSALAEYETAVELNPCLAQAHCGLGDALAYSGRLPKSIAHFEEAIRLSPHDPYRWGFMSYRSLAHLFLRQHESAVEWAAKALQAPNNQYLANANLVAALGHLDRPQETRAAVAELMRRKPEFSCNFARKHLFYIEDSDQLEHFLEGLRKAGIRESDVAEPAVVDAVLAPPLPDVPSIAVLPFANLSGDPEQEYFSDGVADDLITALSQVRSFFVIDRSSSFTFKGKAVAVKDIGRALGVRYVVEGSVRKAGDKVRVSAQLVEAETGNHVWADRYDGALDDIFDLQDQIAASIVGAIEPQIHRAEVKRLSQKRPESFDAYDLTLSGLAHMNRLNPEDTAKALALFQRAINADPNYARSYACASWCYRRRVQLKGMVLTGAERDEAMRLAQAALKADSTDPYVLWQAGLTGALVEGDLEEGMALIERSLSINANANRAWLASSMLRCSTGYPDTAIENAERAIRLSPLDVAMWVANECLATAHLQLGNYETAVECARKSLRLHRDHLPAHLVYAASLALLGRGKEAKAAARELLAIEPGLAVGTLAKRFPIAGYRNLDGFLDGLRLAGLPE